MKDVILVSGQANSGKSSTLRMLYTQLCAIQPEHTFNGNEVSGCQISDFSYGHDFFAVFSSINGKRIGIASNGDYKEEFERVFGIIKDKIDILVCVSRSIDVSGSVREYIFNSLPQEGFSVKFNLTTFPCANDDEKTAMESNISDLIISSLTK